jgi:hypothetical protein
MTVVSSKTFLENPIHYFNLARERDVAVKRGEFVFQIVPKPKVQNPSPSGDPFWNDPRNLAELDRSIKESHSEKAVVTLNTKEDIRKYLGLD